MRVKTTDTHKTMFYVTTNVQHKHSISEAKCFCPQATNALPTDYTFLTDRTAQPFQGKPSIDWAMLPAVQYAGH